MINDQAATPIFLHSSFRTSSTWLWNKFRQARATRAYYEIFNEKLEVMDAFDVQRADYSAWNSKHPVSAPYYLEYLPLIQPGGGVQYFKPSMPFGDFIPANGIDGDLSADEMQYVENLICAAQRENLTPVLTCTRSLGRAKALRKRFGGRTAIVYRNLFHQWASYTGLYFAGHPSFLETVDQTLAASPHDPVLNGINNWFSGRKLTPDDLQMFYAFFFLHLYIYAQAFESSDIAIDATSLVGDREKQQEIGRQLSDWVGDRIDLSDVRSEFEVSVLDVGNRNAFFDTIEQVTKLIVGSCRKPESVAFVHEMKAQALKEWERHEFFTKRNRHIMNSALDRLKAEDDALSRRLDEHAESSRQAVAAAQQQAAMAERARQDQAILSTRLERLERQLSQADRRLKLGDVRQEGVEYRLGKAEKRIVRYFWNTAIVLPIGAPIGALLRAVDRRFSRKRRKNSWAAALPPYRAASVDAGSPIAGALADAPSAPTVKSVAGALALPSRLWIDLVASRGPVAGEPGPVRILLVKVDHIGDLILAFPAIENLRKVWPKAHLTLVCAPNNVGLATTTELFDEIIGFKFFAEYSEDQGASPRPRYDEIATVVRGAFDLAIDLRHDPDSRPLLARVDARYRAGFAVDPNYPCVLDVELPHVEAVGGDNMHNIERLTLLASAIVNRFTPPELGVLAKLEGVGGVAPPFEGQDYVILAPGAGSAIKKWPQEYFSGLAKAIAAQLSLKIVVIGGEREKEVGEAIVAAAGSGEVLDLVGKSSLVDLPRILKGARAFVGNDTGVTHIAALQGVSTLCLFSGAPDVAIWRPVGPATTVLRSEQPCSPCRKLQLSDCGFGHACMREITVETALTQLRALLAEKPKTLAAAEV